MAPGRGPGESFSRRHCSAFCPLSIFASRILIWVNNLGLDFSLFCFHLTRIQSNSLPTNLFFLHCTVYMIGPSSHSGPFLQNPDTLPSCTLHYLQTSLCLQTSLGTSLWEHTNMLPQLGNDEIFPLKHPICIYEHMAMEIRNCYVHTCVLKTSMQ